MEKYINRIKNIFTGDKKSENLVVALVLLVILLLSINYIFKEDEQVVEANSEIILGEQDNSSTESKLEEILSKIEGISEVSVMINYSTTDKIIPVYDVKENIDEEKSDGKTSTTSVTEKSVAYQEGSNGKVPIVESTELAIAQGAIVVGKGVSTRR